MTAEPGDVSAATARRSLESWKEIAAYLGRSVRTVQLWEKEERLPVHRLQGGVLAYPEELDQWVEQRRVSPGASEAPPAEGKPPRRLALLLAAVLAILIAVASWQMIPRREPAPLLRLDAGASLLIATIENRTNEPVFDGSLEYLLERALTQSGEIRVLSAERIADALMLMRKGPQRLERTLAREVAIRDGRVDALIAGRIEKVGRQYVVGVDLISVQSGERLAAFTRNANDHETVRTMVGELAEEIHRALGQTNAGSGGAADPLENVTTHSLRAAQLFTEADRLVAFGDSQTAERLLREAIAEDPEFASAYVHLAYAIHNQGRMQEEYLPFAERGVTFSRSASMRERYFILGSHASMQGNDDQALTHFQKLLEIDPNHFWANNCVASILGRSRRSREALPYRMKAAELRPNQFIVNQTAAEMLELWGDRPEESERYHVRARELLSRADWEQYPLQATRARLRDAGKAWQRGDLAKLLPDLNAATAQALRNRGPGADALMAAVAEFEIALERFERAAELARRIDDPFLRSALTARVAYWSGDLATACSAFREHLALRNPPPKGVGATAPMTSGLGLSSWRQDVPLARDLFLMARCGMTAEVEKLIPHAHATERNQLLAAVSYRQSEDEAIERLLAADSTEFGRLGPPLAQLRLLSYDLLADILERRGERERAIALIETTSSNPLRASFAKPEWVHLQHRLAALNRAIGRTSEAEQVEATLRRITVSPTSHLGEPRAER
jgi:tetratricopeptide (TPR) repeat protein